MKSTTQFKQNKRGVTCLNCEQPISNRDNFCSNCGQVNDELPLSIKQFVSEFFSGFFSFDTRFFNTFIPLLFKPGKVSRDYVEGKRRRYVNPFQLYLHVTIVFFLLQGLFSALDGYKTINSNKKSKDSFLGGIEGEISESKDDLSTIELEKQKTKSYIDSILSSRTVLKELNNDSLTIKQKDSVFNLIYKPTLFFISNLSERDSLSEWRQKRQHLELKQNAIEHLKTILKSKNVNYSLPAATQFSIEKELLKDMTEQKIYKRITIFMRYDDNHPKIIALEALENLELEKSKWNVFYYKIAQDFNKFGNDSNFRNSYFNRIVSKISIALFFMLPIFTGFLALLYVRHKKNYTEHLVFVFNVQTVFFILLIFFVFFDRIFKTDISFAILILVFLFHLYKSLRNFYKQNRLKTVVKFLLLNSIFIILATVGITIISFLAFVL